MTLTITHDGDEFTALGHGQRSTSIGTGGRFQGFSVFIQELKFSFLSQLKSVSSNGNDKTTLIHSIREGDEDRTNIFSPKWIDFYSHVTTFAMSFSSALRFTFNYQQEVSISDLIFLVMILGRALELTTFWQAHAEWREATPFLSEIINQNSSALAAFFKCQSVFQSC